MTSITVGGHVAPAITEGVFTVLTPPVLEELSGYPFLDRLSAGGRERLLAAAWPFEAPPSLFRQEGDPCAWISLLAAGRVRVTKRRASGREITLYTVGHGELCVLEVLAVLAGTPYRAEAVIEERAAGVAIPAAAFRAAVDEEPALRAFLFVALEDRLAMALDLVGDVALGTLEERLAGLLLRHAGGSGEVFLTHERLARELACAREAVSRILGNWERAGFVRLWRGHVELVDQGRLAELAGLAGPAELAGLPGGRVGSG